MLFISSLNDLESEVGAFGTGVQPTEDGVVRDKQ